MTLLPDLIDDRSALVQVMAWCHLAPSHYLSKCWPWSMLPYGITRSHRVNRSSRYLDPSLRRHQAITWANVDHDQCRHMASLDPIELTDLESTWIHPWDVDKSGREGAAWLSLNNQTAHLDPIPARVTLTPSSTQDTYTTQLRTFYTLTNLKLLTHLSFYKFTVFLPNSAYPNIMFTAILVWPLRKQLRHPCFQN